MGELALFGGVGCFDAWAKPLHRKLIELGSGDGTVRIILTRVEDEDMVGGEVDFYADLGFKASVVYVCSRSEAESQANAAALADASLVFLHGGMPAWLADVLRETAVWQVILESLSRGGSVAATSGAIMCLGARVPGFDENFNFSGWAPGLALFRSLVVGSHWDSERFLVLREPYEALPAETRILAVDESTVAVRRESTRWAVAGQGSVHIIGGGRDQRLGSGDHFELDTAI